MVYGITGSTGNFGNSAISHLLDKGIQPASIVALARNEEKARSLKEKGIKVRIATYDDKPSLEKAFSDIDRLLMISGSEIGKRFTQHSNIIEAAKKQGVKQIVYTSLTHAAKSTNPLAPEHKQTEEALKASAIEFVILRNNWYTENYLMTVKAAGESGILTAAVNNGQVASALRSEYAEATVNMLISEGHGGKIYELGGQLWDYRQLASAISSLFSRPVKFKAVSEEEQKINLIKAGMDEGTATFYAALDTSIAEGSLKLENSDLAKLLGRPPLSLEEGLKSLLH